MLSLTSSTKTSAHQYLLKLECQLCTQKFKMLAMELIIFAVTEDHQLSLRLGTMSEPRTTLQSLVFSLNQCPQHGMLLMKIRPLLSHQTSNTFKLLELVSSILIIECQQDSSRKNLDNLMESTSQVILSKHSWILSLL